jgi:hypothetical protein
MKGTVVFSHLTQQKPVVPAIMNELVIDEIFITLKFGWIDCGSDCATSSDDQILE